MPEWSKQKLRIMAQEAYAVGELLVEALTARGMKDVDFQEENGYLEVAYKRLLPTFDDISGLWEEPAPSPITQPPSSESGMEE